MANIDLSQLSDHLISLLYVYGTVAHSFFDVNKFIIIS